MKKKPERLRHHLRNSDGSRLLVMHHGFRILVTDRVDDMTCQTERRPENIPFDVSSARKTPLHPQEDTALHFRSRPVLGPDPTAKSPCILPTHTPVLHMRPSISHHRYNLSQKDS